MLNPSRRTTFPTHVAILMMVWISFVSSLMAIIQRRIYSQRDVLPTRTALNGGAGCSQLDRWWLVPIFPVCMTFTPFSPTLQCRWSISECIGTIARALYCSQVACFAQTNRNANWRGRTSLFITAWQKSTLPFSDFSRGKAFLKSRS